MGCMMTNITVVRGQRCRRSDLIVRALQVQGIPFRLVQAEGEEGRGLIAQYDLRASPGILVDGRSINPFDLIHDCHVDDGAVRRLLLGEGLNAT
jgi:hypothetical protein